MDIRTPIYYQIADELEGKICAGNYQPREKLPSENELVGIFQTSRLTIRRALSELERKGLIYRLHGVGTFVSPDQGINTFGFGGFTERCLNLGLEVSTDVLHCEVIETLPDFFTKTLQFSVDHYEDNRYFFLERIRKINKHSVAFESSYLPLALYPDLVDQFDPRTSLYQFLVNKYKVSRQHTQSILMPYLSNEEDANRFGINAGIPLMEVFFCVWAKAQNVLEYTHSFYTRDFPLRFRWED